MSTNTDDTPDAETLLERIGQRLSGDDDGDASTDADADGGDASGADDDADQKQPDNPVDDLVRALAEELGADPEELKAVIQQAANGDDDEDGDEDEEDDDEDDEFGQDAEDGAGASGEVTIDFGEKLEEHGAVTEDDLEQKLAAFREDVVEDLGQKLAETTEAAVDEIGQKMQSAETDSPAGGTFADEQDFEAKLKEAAGTDSEGW